MSSISSLNTAAITEKYAALETLESATPEVQNGTLKQVVAEALQTPEDTEALRDLLHFSGRQRMPGDKASRLQTRLALIDAVGARSETVGLRAALQEAKGFDKGNHARRSQNSNRFIQIQPPPADLDNAVALLEGLNAWVASPVEALIRDNRTALNRYQKFACTDIGSFPGNVNQKLSAPEQEALLARPGEMSQDQLLADKFAQTNANKRPINQEAVGKVHKFLEKSKGGCCSTFAFATAHVLTGGSRDPDKAKPRVEVLAHQDGMSGTHCFTVVGRAEGSSISDPSTWGENAMIVDGWLGSLGHPTTFTVDDYPYAGFLHANDSPYDSHQPDPPDVEFDPMAFLRNRG